MRSHRLFIASGVLLLVGLSSLSSKWDGSAGITAGDSVGAWAVTFNGSVHGWPALIGVLAILGALVVFLLALVRVLLKSTSGEAQG